METEQGKWMITLAGAAVLAVIHLQAYRLKFVDVFPRSKWLSFAGGVSIAYIFVHLLPELERMQHLVVKEEVAVLKLLRFPLYVLALLSLCIYYGIERWAKLSGESEKKRQPGGPENPGSGEEHEKSRIFYFHIFSFAVYNALIGYTIRREAWELSTLLLFVLAIGFHFMVNDLGFVEHYRNSYIRRGRWILGVAPLAGWALGSTDALGEHHQGIVLAFIAGGTILNVLKEELPEERKSNFWAFLAGAFSYSALLLLLE